MNQKKYNVQVTSDLDDSEWDAFVANVPGGHHVQTALWAQLKDSLGWRTLRITVREEGNIVGGAQILIRPIPVIGALGYVTKGPLLALDEPTLEELVMKRINQECKANKIGYLIVQPPSNREDMSTRMPKWGFNESLLPITPTPYTTVLVDLNKGLEDLLSEMKSTTRRNIRLAERRGIIVREGTDQELTVFYQTLMATANRQDFKEYPEEYWRQFYNFFSSKGNTKILFATYQDEIVSTLLLVNFGYTVIYKKGGWTGEHANLHPNELMHWEAIQWSKSKGYRYYDFEGIPPEAALAVKKEGALPKEFVGALPRFKLGFGGEVTFFPQAFDVFYNPVVNWMYKNLFAKISHFSVVHDFIFRFTRS